MEIGIDLNEVLRQHREIVIYFYEKEMKKKLSEHEGMELEDIIKFEEGKYVNYYMDNPLDVFYSTRDKISKEVITKSPELMYNEFLYQDYLVEIFGTAPKTYKDVGLDLNGLVHYNPNHNFKILVKDKNITIGPSLMFLSSIRPNVKEYRFVNTDDELWAECDLYITSNRDIINSIPENKKAIKVNTEFNKNAVTEYSIDRLGDLNINKILENYEN